MTTPTPPQLGFPTFTSYVSPANPGVPPGASDMNRIVADLIDLVAPPTCVATRYDTSLVADSTFHDCRFDTVRWDWSPDGVKFCPDLASGAAFTSTFVIPWSGFYDITAVERFSAPTSTTGYVEFQLLLDNGIPIDQDLAAVNVGFQQQLRINTTWRLDAGTSIKFQHKAVTNNPITLYTDFPTPLAVVKWRGRNVI